jgi:hypothetical protein
MLYSLPTPQPDTPLSYEQELPMLLRLAKKSDLKDTVSQNDPGGQHVVLPEHQPIFENERKGLSAYPEPGHVNQLVIDGLVSVHLSPWALNDLIGVRRNSRRFKITDKGIQWLTEHVEP